MRRPTLADKTTSPGIAAHMNAHQFVVLLPLLLAFISTGCTSLSTPTRPVYEGDDSVSRAVASQFVGIWRVTDLNPLPDAVPQETIIEYRANGTVVGQVNTHAANNAANDAQNLTYRLTGNWSLSGDTIVHSSIRMISDSNDKTSQLLSAIINSSSQQLGGQANVYELTENRLVMVGTDGAAMEYVRLK